MVHSFADGAALGAGLYVSASGTAEGLGMIIFAAIMLHKAPATLGFGSFVHHQGCRGWELAKHILAFTLSAPIVTILVYFGLATAESEATDTGSFQWWVGILMLLSAGSFLYVATIHILPEVYAMDHEHGKTQVEQLLKHQETHYSKSCELLVLLLGLYLPVALSVIPHEHAHPGHEHAH